MIILFGAAGPAFGLPEASPFVTKTEIQLKMAALDYRKEPAAPSDGPKGQVPFIEDAGVRVGDSTFIRRHLERRYGIDFDEGLDARQRAEAWACERMLENHLTPAQVHFRWRVPANFAKGPAHFFDRAPEAMQASLREQAVLRVGERIRGTLGAHDDAEIASLGVHSLSALSVLLGERPFLMSERPCGADATALAVLAAVYTPFFPSPLHDRAHAFANLVAYTDRLMALFYPEFAWKAPAVVLEPSSA